MMQFSFPWVGLTYNQLHLLHCRKYSWTILPSPSLVTRTSPKATVSLLFVVDLLCRCHLYGTSFLLFQGSHPLTFLLLWPGTKNTCNFIRQLFFPAILLDIAFSILFFPCLPPFCVRWQQDPPKLKKKPGFLPRFLVHLCIR